MQYIVGLLQKPGSEEVRAAKVSLDTVLPKDTRFQLMTGPLTIEDATEALRYLKSWERQGSSCWGRAWQLTKIGRSWAMQPIPWPDDDDEIDPFSNPGSRFDDIEDDSL